MFQFIQPEIFSDIDHIECCFTEANRHKPLIKEMDQVIPGMNFGLNSEAPVPEVEENYDTLLNLIGWNPKQLAIARQIHGKGLKVVEKPGIYTQTDGLITSRKDVALGIQVADCAAVLVAESNPEKPVIGAFHAGWRGALKGIVPEGIKKMVQEGGELSSFKVYISPCISVQNFEVGIEVASEFPSEYCDNVSYEKPHIDLKKFIRDQLIDSGVYDHNIECSPHCTIKDDRFYSYRRERSSSGRMLGLIKYV